MIHVVKRSKKIAQHALTPSSVSHLSITSAVAVVAGNKMDANKSAKDKQLTNLLEEARKLKEDLRLDKAKLVDARCGYMVILDMCFVNYRHE